MNRCTDLGTTYAEQIQIGPHADTRFLCDFGGTTSESIGCPHMLCASEIIPMYTHPEFNMI